MLNICLATSGRNEMRKLPNSVEIALQEALGHDS